MAYEKMSEYINAELNNALLEEGYKWCVRGELRGITIDFYGESYSYKNFYFNDKAEAEEFCKKQNKKYPQLGYKISVEEVKRWPTSEDWANWRKDQDQDQEKEKEVKKQKRLENEAKRAAAQGLTVEEYRSKKTEERKAKARVKRIQEIKEEIAKLTKELENLEKK